MLLGRPGRARKCHHVGKKGQNYWNNALALAREDEASGQSGGRALTGYTEGSSEARWNRRDGCGGW